MNSDVLLLKKKLKEIKKYKGEGTQLISLYLPVNVDRSAVTKQLTEEISQSANIKSQQTRKNVQAALRRIITYLRQIDFKLPKHGLVLFAGNVTENPAKNEVVLLTISPPKPLNTKLYRCDSEFHTGPLEEMAETDEIYGLIAIDKREATIAIIRGKAHEIVARETSGVPGKARAGGQSAARFERLREKAAESFYKRVGERVNTIFLEEEKLKGIIVGGPGLTKNEFLEAADFDHRLRQKVMGSVDICYTDESGIKEILDKSGDILKDASLIIERKLLDKFIALVATNAEATYGLDEVIESLNMGKADNVLLSEGLEWHVIKYKCQNCDHSFSNIVKDLLNKPDEIIPCEKCEGSAEELEIIDFYEHLLELAMLISAKVTLISNESSEGMQFLNVFGGLGALLRYK